MDRKILLLSIIFIIFAIYSSVFADADSYEACISPQSPSAPYGRSCGVLNTQADVQTCQHKCCDENHGVWAQYDGPDIPASCRNFKD